MSKTAWVHSQTHDSHHNTQTHCSARLVNTNHWLTVETTCSTCMCTHTHTHSHTHTHPPHLDASTHVAKAHGFVGHCLSLNSRQIKMEMSFVSLQASWGSEPALDVNSLIKNDIARQRGQIPPYCTFSCTMSAILSNEVQNFILVLICT
jgi:hypothetical protein